MLCVFCLLLVRQTKLTAPLPATCTVRGTSLCTVHALWKLQKAHILQDSGLSGPIPLPK